MMFVIGVLGCATPTPTDNTNDNTNGNVDSFTPSGVTFGAIQPDPEDVERRPQAINPFAASANAELPKSADLSRDLPPIGNQGSLGSCTAWASGYAAATYTASRQYGWGANTNEHQASPGYLYEMLLETDGFECGSGTLISTAMNLLIQTGCSSFAVVGYSDNSCEANPAATDADNFRIGSFNRVVPTDRYAVRAELAAGRILVIGAELYDDFMEHTGNSVYTGSGVFLSQGEQHAAHAMACVGYDDERGAYRIMNSWSTQWGDSGFMWMSYDTFEKTVFELYSIEPSSDREPPTPDPDDDSNDDTDPTPDGEVTGTIDDAFQFADADPRNPDQQLVYLVFYYHFSEPVMLRSITVTDPVGGQGMQDYSDTWYSDGYIYFVQEPGQQWMAGTYGIEFDTQTQAGEDILFSGEAEIAALSDDGGTDDKGTCSNICMFAYDGECDDGGTGSSYTLCDYGTDCADCGVREEGDGGNTDGDLCSDTCRWAGDGVCDDGGTGATYSDCDYGTDCTDCGARSWDDVYSDDLCDDSCRWAYDGVCDDGGDGGDQYCDYGTDCADCGPRNWDDLWDDFFDDPTQLCDDTCEYANDGVCDDGEIGAMYAVCYLGTDCSDCGPRTSDDGWFKEITRTFRGIPIETPPTARDLPAAGVHDGTLGSNRRPLSIRDTSRVEK